MNTYKEPLYIFIDIFASQKKNREREKIDEKTTKNKTDSGSICV